MDGPGAPALARLTLYHFRHRLSRPISTIMGPVTARPALVLKIEDTEGAAGYGEIWCNFPPDGDLHRMRLACNILPDALSAISAGPETAFFQLARRFHNLSLQAGEPGPLAQVAAGADIALADLAARRAGVPLAVHLGAERVGPVPAYASGISPDIWPGQLERMRARGFRDFKLRIGFGVEDSLPELARMVAALAPDERLRVDANQSWSFDTALARVRKLGAFDLHWLEEPLRADAPWPEWQRLADASPVPLAAGENLRTAADFGAAIASGAIRVVQPDICKWGGLNGAAEVARQALAAGLSYCPHYLGGGVGLMASAHLLAAVGGPGLLEVDSSENPLSAGLSAHDGSLAEGRFPIPDAPGLGYDPDIACCSDMLREKIEIPLSAY
ncbi:mandelate racemase/muconate lactonizing enzyme family protein [Rhodobium gokarnense]|uniref:L-alanine-DL-glutamate epimerase-like enolase superfamily enzyme n=1 Tax=Rhodobium gokarnense TaxID=364296 RepID=A0ABT3H7F0_9HYPH|nr:mandelate racemase/muconate lactonizing enzyme family protein [Rhodobium gokarnense]MCW2306304.1 L-alanine-DL-glutamate epimerase-like enolase superfamily enzyme [Rhodobium gokarnense]